MSKTLTRKYISISFAALTLSIVCPVFLWAQTARKIEKKADESFKNKNYYNAAVLYSTILYETPIAESKESMIFPVQSYTKSTIHKIKESDRNRVIYKLAESYRLYDHYKEAAAQYQEYIASKDALYPLAELWYGYCLLANNDPQKAIIAFNTFLKKYHNKNDYTEKAYQGIASCNLNLSNTSEKPTATITKLQSTVSEDGSNFALDKMNDSLFWFTSSRHELEKNQKKIYPLRLYAGNFKTNTAAKVFDQVIDNMNMAASSFTNDGNTVFFTGWKEDTKSATQTFAIYYMNRPNSQSKWSSPVMLPSPVNVKDYQSKQPMISADGKYLLFSSNQPGGSGKFDIWMVAMDAIKPIGNALNLGAQINTAGNEVTPFYYAADSKLTFSSDGRLGMGGMDIYATTGNLSLNQWNDSIINLGVPYNSVKDDQYYKTDRNADTGYLSSDRFSSCCLEIFRIVKIKKIDTLVDYASAKQVLSPSNKKEEVEPVAETKEKHLIDSINSITFIRKNVYYNFAKYQVRKEDYSQLNDIVTVLEKNPDLNILIASFTDCIGSMEANIRLSRKRSESVRWYLMSKGISTSRINIDFFGKEHFIMQCKEYTTYHSNQQLANRRSDLIITKATKPKWVPSGRELDITKIKNDSNYHSLDFYAITRKMNITHSAYTKKADLKIPPRDKVQPTVERLPGITWNYNQKKYMVPIPNKLLMAEILDMTPRLKESDLIDEMTKRVPRKPLEVYSSSDSVRIDLYDNGVFDYDTVSVIFDKHIAVYKELLQVDKPISFYVKLNGEQRKNEMIFFAENLGLTPPNSALMVITDADNKRTEVSVASDLNHNVVIYFIKLNKGQQK